MKKIKRVLVFLLSICCFLNTNIGHLTTVSADTTQCEVSIDANGGDYIFTDSSGSSFSTNGQRFTVGQGLTLRTYAGTIADPVKAGCIFDGWLEHTYTYDANNNPEYTVVGARLLTTDAMLDFEVQNDKTAFIAQWSVDPSAAPSSAVVELKAEPGRFYYNDPTHNSTGYYSGTSYEFNNGTLVTNGVTIKDPIYVGMVFKGWELNQIDFTSGAPRYIPVTGVDLLTTTEVLNYTLPNYAVAFIAQWENDTRTTINAFFNANGGTVTVDNMGHSWSGNTCGDYFPAGATLKQYAFTVSDPVFWDPAREFLGWIPCKQDRMTDNNGNVSYEWVQIEGSTLLSTAQILEYTLPEYDIQFRAQWDGNESDYYSNVEFDTYTWRIGGEDSTFKIRYYGNEQITNDWEWGFKRNGDSIATQEGSNFSIVEEPTRASARFLGWLEYKNIDAIYGGMYPYRYRELVSERVYTTAEILAKPVPDYDVSYVAKWDDIAIEEYRLDVRGIEIKAEPGEFYYDDPIHHSTGYYNGISYAFDERTLADNGVTITNPIERGLIFKGWLLSYVDYTSTEPIYTPIQGMDLLTTEEILTYELPYNLSLAFVAQWESDPRPMINVFFNAKDCTVSVDNMGHSWSGESCGEFFPAGATLEEYGFSVEDPVFWDANRAFVGWMACTQEEITEPNGNTHFEMVQIPGSNVMSTEEALKYTLPNHDIYFIAQWAGDDADYYSHVYINGYNAPITFTNIRYENDQPVTWDEMAGCWGNDLRKNGESIREQTQDYFRFKTEPDRSGEGVRFEGWLEFKVTYEENYYGDVYEKYTLISNTLYTTDQMLDRPVPSYSVAYVAKWSDMKVEDYFRFVNKQEVMFDGNGGDFKYSNSVYGIEWNNGSCSDSIEIGSIISTEGVSVSNPRRHGYIFKGWKVCTVDFSTNRPEYSQIAGTGILTTEEILAYRVPNYTIAFVAEWEVDNRERVIVSFEGMDGEFAFDDGFDRGTTNWYNYEYPVGSNVKAEGLAIQDPVYWNPARGFLGWQVCTSTDEGLVPIEGVALMTTEAALNYLIPNYNIYFVAQWAGSDSDYYSQTLINCYGGEMQVKETYRGENGEIMSEQTYSTDSFGRGLREIGTIREQIGDSFAITADPSRNDARFEGWMIYKFEELTYEDGSPYCKYTRVNNNLYTTAQVMDMSVTHYDVAYVAKWSDLSLEDYFPFDGAMEPHGQIINVQIDGNGGTFDFKMENETFADVQGSGRDLVAGTKLKQYRISISDLKFWNTNRSFVGWKAYVLVEKIGEDNQTFMEWEQIAGTGIMSTATMLTYELPNCEIRFEAQWSGKDEDYYSDVVIEGYGALFEFSDSYYRDGELITEYIECEGWGNRFKKNGQTLREQVGNEFSIVTEPSRNDATFEGWLEFKTVVITDGIGYEEIVQTLVSETLYTTDQIMDKVIPNYNVTYAAKWSDIPVKEYYTRETAIILNANGGEIEVSVLDGGNPVTIHTNVLESWYSECYTVGEGLQRDDKNYVDTTMRCAELTGWTVYEFEGVTWEEVQKGDELNVGDSDCMFVYVDTYMNEDGVEMDRYLGMVYPSLVGNALTTDELMGLSGDKLHYAVAKWEESHMNIQIEKTNRVEPSQGTDGSYDKQVSCAACGWRAEPVTIALKLTPQGIIADYIPSAGTVYLEQGVAYQMGEGSWSASGDSTVYAGGSVFYISQNIKCDFSVAR